MSYLCFKSEETAEQAAATISANMGLKGAVTETWDIPRSSALGAVWHIRKPEERFMAGVKADAEVDTYLADVTADVKETLL